MKTSFLLIVFILLVTFYFYGNKIREVASPYIEQSKKSGVLFYVTGIWDNMKGVQQRSDEHNQRVMELTGNTKKVADKAGLYSLEIPESWKVSIDQGAAGRQLSKLVIQSPTFAENSLAGETYYNNGAQLSLRVLRGEQENAGMPTGKISGRKTVQVGNESASYEFVSQPTVKTGEVIISQFIHAGNTYAITFVYNKERFSDGEYTLNEILASFMFKDGAIKK